jgi:hypothetical protein
MMMVSLRRKNRIRRSTFRNADMHPAGPLHLWVDVGPSVVEHPFAFRMRLLEGRMNRVRI